MAKIDIRGIDKARLLQELYEGSRPQGMGHFQFRSGGLTDDEARALIAEGTSFDYLQGRVMKVDIGGDEMESRLYDRDLGEGACAAAVAAARLPR